MTRRLGRLAGDAGGSNLIEAAIITPLMLLLTFSIVDFASLLYAYLALENGVSQATRFAVTGNLHEDPDSPGSELSRVDSIKLTMRNATPTLTIPDEAFAFHHIPPGGSDWQAGTGGPNSIEKLTVTYTWALMTPLLRPFFPGGQITLVVDSAMKNEERWE
jgi:Flp pilus assembly protein TadG